MNISTSFIRFERYISSASQTPINARLGKLRIRELMESSILVNSQGEAVVMKNPKLYTVCKSCFQCFMPTIYITLCTLGWFGEYIFYCCEICLLLYVIIQLIPYYLNLIHVCYIIYLNRANWTKTVTFRVYWKVFMNDCCN